MKKLISFITAVSLLFLSTLSLFSCGGEETPEVNGPPSAPTYSDYEFVTPKSKDYQRGTINFNDIEYVRPNATALIDTFKRITVLIEADEVEYASQLEEIGTALESYYTFLTMSAYTELMMYRDTSAKKWQAEYEYTSTSYHAIYDALEDMCVAAARSQNAENFEADYFGDGFIEEYADGGFYTDTLVALFEEESELTADYNSLTIDSIKIFYKGREGTVDEVLAFFEEYYGKDSYTYRTAYGDCLALYESAYNEAASKILIDLFKVRRKISDELGLESYAEYAYSTLYHDYTQRELVDYLKAVANDVMPVYKELYSNVFSPYFETYVPKEVTKYDVINDLYYTYNRTDSDLATIYSYMLQHGLFDCGEYSSTRFDGAFTTYLSDYEAPFLFATVNSYTDDYLTVAHEFGHFADMYTNYNGVTSLDLAEVYSTSMEMIGARALKESVSEDEYKYLSYSAIASAFNAIIYQGFYALFEHYAYGIEYEEISEETLLLAMKAAAEDMKLDSSIFTKLDYVIIPHIVLYPFYVQSYCTSSAVALEIYTMESKKAGSGLEAYKKLLSRSDAALTLEEELERAGLASPFEKNKLKSIAYDIYYEIMGSHYVESSDPSTNV